MRSIHLLFDANDEYLGYADGLWAAIEMAFRHCQTGFRLVQVMQPNNCVLVCKDGAVAGSHSCLAPEYRDKLKALLANNLISEELFAEATS